MWAILELTKTKRRNVKLQQLWNLQTWSDKFTLCVFDKYTLQKNKSPNLKWQIHTLCILQINTAKKHIPNLKWQIKKLNLKFTFLLLVWPCLESRTRAASTAIQGFYFYAWSLLYYYRFYIIKCIILYIMLILTAHVIKIFTLSNQSSYLSQISQIIFVEKNCHVD